ncbi:BspA family leucine-rich repeat surface protein [Enterococcus casseliflavus]|nr:BspA family leucine-rich repeat surface protein [Enterococcus casseliflavus]MBO1143428.1 BspA family leucine-rich repeat surface protein [Enterococcus casseliflavus]
MMKKVCLIVLGGIIVFAFLLCMPIVEAQGTILDGEAPEKRLSESSLSDDSQVMADPAIDESQQSEDSRFKEEKNLELEDEVRKDDSEDERFVSQDTGIWGNVSWEWEEETVTLTLQGGNAGTVAAAPWKTYSSVQKIIVQDRITLQSNAANLFSNLTSLTYVDALSFDTSQVTTMDFLFANCTSLSVLNLNGWDTRNVRTVNRTFHNMTELVELDLSSWNTTNLASVSSNSWFIFEARNLRTIHLGENTTFLHMGSSSPRFPSEVPSNEYTGNWVHTKDQFGNQVGERVVAPRSSLLSAFYDGSQPGTYVLEKWQTITINPIDQKGNFLTEKQTIRGGYLEDYSIIPPSVLGWHFDYSDWSLQERFTGETTEVNLFYRLNETSILDPINPEVEITPELMPELPKETQRFRIDFVPFILFGTQNITTHEQEYYAGTLKINGSNEERPNFVQVSNFDRTITSWTLSVRQESQFQTSEGDLLLGASLSFKNAELISIHDQKVPTDYPTQVELVPEETSLLFKTIAEEGAGTWIYRFGDSKTMSESIKLTVPGSTMPNSKEYNTTIIWTINAIP